ncbi:hypothetical protein HQ520_15350 [bacterium]|nr:hypothetical protein [bacterium]
MKRLQVLAGGLILLSAFAGAAPEASVKSDDLGQASLFLPGTDTEATSFTVEVEMRTQTIEEDYGVALAAVAQHAVIGLHKGLNVSMPGEIVMDLEGDLEGEQKLWHDREGAIHIRINSPEQLNPPNEGGVLLIYGVCHELSQMALYRHITTPTGIGPAMAEGWPFYAGSVLVDLVSTKLGAATWPVPYDFAEAEGTGRLRRTFKGKGWGGLSHEQRGARVFWELEQRHGRKAVWEAFGRALASHPTGTMLLPTFFEALQSVTGDPNAGKELPEEAFQRRVKWLTADRDVPVSFFEGQKIERDDRGALLLYDNGEAKTQHALAGSGHTVLFRRPEGNWKADWIGVHAGRYGSSEVKGCGILYLLDKDFKTFYQKEIDYDRFSDKPGWVTLPVDADLPERFYVCVFMDPTAERGVSVFQDNSKGRLHAYGALPESHIRNAKGGEWMIRVHVVKGKK